MLNPFNQTVIAAESKDPVEVSTDQINVPLDLLLGSIVGGLVLFFSIIWWVRGLSSKVEESVKDLSELEKRIALERQEDIKQRKELRDDVKHSFKLEITQSASDICHGFELFAMEMRGELKKLTERLDDRNATVNRLGKKVDHLGTEMIGMAKQLQNQGMPIHYRRDDNGPPSTPPNYYDED